MKTDEQTDGCWLTGVKGLCKAVEETQGPQEVVKRGRDNRGLVASKLQAGERLTRK